MGRLKIGQIASYTRSSRNAMDRVYRGGKSQKDKSMRAKRGVFGKESLSTSVMATYAVSRYNRDASAV